MKLILILLLLFPYALTAQNISETHSHAVVANTFINSLDYDQKKNLLFGFNDINRYDWHYFPASMHHRNGIAIKNLNPDQKEN